MIPELNDTDYVILSELITNYPREFYTDMTGFFITQMNHYIDTGMVWRVSIMGPTRIGKSEIGSSICFLYKKRLNKNIKKGVYKQNSVLNTMFESGDIRHEEIEFNTEFVYGSPSEYMTKQKERAKNDEIRFGQIHQVDEDKKSSGGLGTMSQAIEIQNINNISAKFMQCEVWITPDYMITKNAPFGLRAYKKDYENRLNHCLLYKIEMNTNGNADFKFLGWVSMPLHPYDKFRIAYNKIKDGWIKGEIEGKGDARSESRFNVAKMLSESNMFSLKESGKMFKYSKAERIAYLEQLILKGEVQSFNEIEKCRIIDQATLLKKTQDENV